MPRQLSDVAAVIILAHVTGLLFFNLAYTRLHACSASCLLLLSFACCLSLVCYLSLSLRFMVDSRRGSETLLDSHTHTHIRGRLRLRLSKLQFPPSAISGMCGMLHAACNPHFTGCCMQHVGSCKFSCCAIYHV